MQFAGQFSFISVFLRLTLAMLAGGVIGYGRSKKRKAAGLRTFMLMSMGASLTVMLALYEHRMLSTDWAPAVQAAGLKFDGSRYAAQVISGSGFIAAGTIISGRHQQVDGLTTATGMFASVCMGLAAGAGFYLLVILLLAVILLALDILYPLEPGFKRRVRNFSMYVEFLNMEVINTITEAVLAQGAQIFEVDIENTKAGEDRFPSAIFTLRLSRDNYSHSSMLTAIAELDCVQSIQELVA